jgi:two-component system, NtrC family, sensor kinase
MKKLFFSLVILTNVNFAFPQADIGSSFANENYADSLLIQVQKSADDTTKVKLLSLLGDYYTFIRQDSSVLYFAQSIELSERINYPPGSYSGYAKMAFVLNTASNYAKSLEMALRSLRIAEKFKTNREESMARSYNAMGLVNRRLQNDTTARNQCMEAIDLYKQAGISMEMPNMNFAPLFNLALIYLKWKKWDSAYYYAKNSYDISLRYPARAQAQVSVTATTLADVYAKTGRLQLAREYFMHAVGIDKKYNVPLLRVRLYNNIAAFYKDQRQLDSCIYYAETAFELCRNHQFGEQSTDAASLIAQAYELLNKPDSALKYTKIFMAERDTIFNQAKLIQIQLLTFDEGQRQKDLRREINSAQERFTNRVRYYTLTALAGFFLFLTLFLFRNNRNKKIANKTLESQKKEIDQQRAKAETALQDLKSTQAQLIQSEKMASLGELTAGIAHEIQNPLNFVNNFSEINRELLEELYAEIKSGQLENLKEAMRNILDNEIKINTHGKRADAIVKGMLQHSRRSTGQKELTDINMLADEYLRLSYHGLKAKESLPQVTIKTDFDQNIDKIYIIPQDIGRVFLNLYNNAFYAVFTKKKLHPGNYEPAVSITSGKELNSVIISIRDNGNGIPDKIRDKIFQPFFTTKPTGQGTGLGLSLSYDVIKAHGGTITLNSVENEFTEFIIKIPYLR